MEIIEKLKGEVERRFYKSELERIIGLPQNILSGVFSGSKKLSKKSLNRVEKYFADFPNLNPIDLPNGFVVERKKKEKRLVDKITVNDIKKGLMIFAKGNYDVVLPNFFFGYSECDIFRITESDLVIEYEIKMSKSDFYADFKKKCNGESKHDNLKSGNGKYCPNRFFFVVPSDLIPISDVPEYAGLIYYSNGWFTIKKNAKLIHKNKFDDYRSICRTLSNRDEGQRKRIEEIRNTDFDKEMNLMKKELEQAKREKRELSNDYFILKHTKRKENA